MYRFSRSIYRDLAPYLIDDSSNARTGLARASVAANGGAAANGNGNGRASAQAAVAALANGNGHAPCDGAANGAAGLNGSGAAAMTNRRRLLDACEATMRRLAYDHRYFAHPARSLFCEVRTLFPIQQQDRALRVIERNIKLALEHLERLPDDGVSLNGQPSECRAHTRKGTPCRRTPLPGRDYCPSHKHLEEPVEGVEGVPEAEAHAAI